MIHCFEKVFGGRSSHDFVLKIGGFCRCYKRRYLCPCSVEDLLVNCEFGFAPFALSSSTGTLSMGYLRSEPGGGRAVGYKTSCGWGMSVEEMAKGCVKVFWKVVCCLRKETGSFR